MHTGLAWLLATALVALVASPAAALDCGEVAKLSAEGKSPRDIAMALSVTTPQVEQCLASPEPAKARRGPEYVDPAVERDEQLEGDLPDRGPLWDQE